MADSCDDDEYHSAEEEVTNNKTQANKTETDEHIKTTSPQTTDTKDTSSSTSENTNDNNINEEQVEFVSNLDNRYVSEGTDDVKGEKVELTEEQIKEMKEQANKLKASGNEAFKSDRIQEAVELYSEAINVYPPNTCSEELAICYANRAACNIKLENHEDVVQDCTKALELRPEYLKALMRRALSNEALEKLEEALEDYKKVLELDPTQHSARQAVMRLPEQIKEQQEKMKAEMIGKLKELGDAVLKPFGLSTNNFQLQQDPNTGGYSVNFKR